MARQIISSVSSYPSEKGIVLRFGKTAFWAENGYILAVDERTGKGSYISQSKWRERLKAFIEMENNSRRSVDALLYADDLARIRTMLDEGHKILRRAESQGDPTLSAHFAAQIAANRQIRVPVPALVENPTEAGRLLDARGEAVVAAAAAPVEPVASPASVAAGTVGEAEAAVSPDPAPAVSVDPV